MKLIKLKALDKMGEDGSVDEQFGDEYVSCTNMGEFRVLINGQDIRDAEDRLVALKKAIAFAKKIDVNKVKAKNKEFWDKVNKK